MSPSVERFIKKRMNHTASAQVGPHQRTAKPLSPLVCHNLRLPAETNAESEKVRTLPIKTKVAAHHGAHLPACTNYKGWLSPESHSIFNMPG